MRAVRANFGILMSQQQPTLHLVCGKAASGKSTLTAQLGTQQNTVVIAEDDWLSVLYADQMGSIADYVRNASRLQKVMGPHVANLLGAGMSVVLDFPGNTVAQRAWMRDILHRTKAAHRLHVLDVPDHVCLERLRARNASGDHPFALSEDQFAQLSKHFVPPTADEGFDVVLHRWAEGS